MDVKGVAIMTHNTRKTGIFTLALGLAMCLTVILGIISVNPKSVRADTMTIDTLEVAFGKVNVGDSLAAAFEFENETERTLKVPDGAKYTATLLFVSKNGQMTTLWDKDKASFPWSRVENQLIERNVAYCIRVRFEVKENYKLSKDDDALKRKLKVSGAELGKGKDVELWDAAGQFADLTAVDMDFIISKGLTYIGYRQTIYPKIDEEVTGKIGTLYTGTGMWLRGAPGPYAYMVKAAPVGTKLDKHNGFNDDESTCYYQIIAKNAMDGGTMYVTATAADGQTCDIPVTIAAVSGGHEHTWVEEIGKIDYEHHGYTKCADPACPGVAPAFDKGSQYASHEFDGGCTEKCTTCGNLDNPNAKHNLADLVEETPATCIAGGMKAHYKCTVCGKYFDADKNETTEEALKTPISPYYGHSFGFWVEEQYATCQAPGRKGYKHCSICNKDYDASNTEIIDFVIPVNPDGHELDDLVAEIPATCKDTGVKEHRDCRLCGKHCDPITRKEIADLTIPTTNDHTFGGWTDEVAPTTTEFGTKGHKDCAVCERHFDKDGNEITDLRIAKIGTHKVTVNGENKIYNEGEKVTAIADDPAEGKEFVGWQDESGNIVSNDKAYTFTVTGATTLTAVYDDMPSGGGEITPSAKNDGLSGGAIAGIVTGSVAVAGLGGFTIFWFAVKKKTFADLIASFKGAFKKK